MQSATARFLRYLQVERNASDLTIKSYREDLSALMEFLGGETGVVPRPATSRRLTCGNTCRPCIRRATPRASVARHLATLRSFFRFALREGLARQNPAKPLRNPRPDRKLPHFLTTDEIARLLHAPDAAEPQGLRDRAILETMYSAGLRVGELVAINDDDLDLEGGLVRVRGKGRRERLAPLGSYAVRAIDEWRSASAHHPVHRGANARCSSIASADDSPRAASPACWRST